MYLVHSPDQQGIDHGVPEDVFLQQRELSDRVAERFLRAVMAGASGGLSIGKRAGYLDATRGVSW